MGNGIEAPKFCLRGHLKKCFKSGHWCYECSRERRARMKVENPAKWKEWNDRGNLNSKSNDLKRQFGIDLNGYNKLFSIQNGMCKICGVHQSKLNIALHVDHDHITGRIRGLLCKKCNSMIGFACENVEILRKAIGYMESI